VEKRSKSQTFTTIFVPKRPTSKSIRSTFGLDEEGVGGRRHRQTGPKRMMCLSQMETGRKSNGIPPPPLPHPVDSGGRRGLMSTKVEIATAATCTIAPTVTSYKCQHFHPSLWLVDFYSIRGSLYPHVLQLLTALLRWHHQKVNKAKRRNGRRSGGGESKEN